MADNIEKIIEAQPELAPDFKSPEQDKCPEQDQSIRDAAVEAALMDLLEVKFASFMGRADLSSSPPQDKVAMRAAYFLGVSAGISMVNTMNTSSTDEG